MRIGIAASSRFHVLDLARELAARGHDVDFYSFLHRHRAMAFGLPGECHVDLFAMLAPAALWQFKAGKIAPKLQAAITWRWLDRVVEANLQPCDVFAFMSGMYLNAARSARQRYRRKACIA